MSRLCVHFENYLDEKCQWDAYKNRKYHFVLESLFSKDALFHFDTINRFCCFTNTPTGVQRPVTEHLKLSILSKNSLISLFFTYSVKQWLWNIETIWNITKMVTLIIHYLPYRFCTPGDKYDKHELPDRISLRCSRTCHSKPNVCLRRRLDRIRLDSRCFYLHFQW